MVVKPIYGLPESDLNLYITYLECHMERLNMVWTTVDPCVLVKSTDGCLTGLGALQVDEYLSLGDTSFLKEEKEALSNSRVKIEA